MKKFTLKKAAFLLLVLSCLLFTGCWSSRELNTLAMVICMGIDKTPNGYLLSQQVLNPKAIASKKSVNEPAVVLYEEKGEDIFEIIRKTTTKCPRKLYYSHLRMVILSEEAAKYGIKDLLDFFSRDHEFRTDFYFVISKGSTAKDVLSVLTQLDSVPGIDLYNSLSISERAWAPTKSIKIVELVNSIISEGKNPVLTGVEITGDRLTSVTVDSLKKVDIDNKLQYTNLGVMNDDKLVGWLNEAESKGYNYMVGNVKSTVGTVQYGENIRITNEVLNAKSKFKAYMMEGKPAIDVNIKIEQNIGRVEGDFDVSIEENLDIINKLSESKLTDICYATLKRAQTDLKTDIFGFGESIHRAYPELWEKMKDDWNMLFPELYVSINVEVKTKQLGQITKPLFMKGNK